MVGSSENSRKKPRRWVLRSPGGNPKIKFTDSDQKGQGPEDNNETGGAPSAEDERLVSASSVAATDSAAGFHPSAGPRISSSPLSRLRSKVTGPASRIITKGLRRRSPDQRGGGGTTHERQQQRLSTEEEASGKSPHTPTNHDVNLVDDRETSGVKDALVAQEEDSKTRKFTTNYFHDTSGSGRCDRDDDQDVDAAAAAKHQTRRNQFSGRESLSVPSAVKAGKQLPRIAFIGVFLHGVEVALASFVPFGSADARIALVKSVRLCRWKTDSSLSVTQTELTLVAAGKEMKIQAQGELRAGIVKKNIQMWAGCQKCTTSSKGVCSTAQPCCSVCRNIEPTSLDGPLSFLSLVQYTSYVFDAVPVVGHLSTTWPLLHCTRIGVGRTRRC